MGYSMSGFVLGGDTSGAVTLIAAAVAGTNTITLPAESGTALTTASNIASQVSTSLPSFSVLNVLQTVNSTSTAYSATSFQDHGLAVTITPKSASSKILVLTQVNGLYQNQGTYAVYATFRLMRDSTVLVSPYGNGPMNVGTNGSELGTSLVHFYLDTPNTTSAVTYKSQVGSGGTSGAITLQYASTQSTITVIEFK